MRLHFWVGYCEPASLEVDIDSLSEGSRQLLLPCLNTLGIICRRTIINDGSIGFVSIRQGDDTYHRVPPAIDSPENKIKRIVADGATIDHLLIALKVNLEDVEKKFSHRQGKEMSKPSIETIIGTVITTRCEEIVSPLISTVSDLSSRLHSYLDFAKNNNADEKLSNQVIAELGQIRNEIESLKKSIRVINIQLLAMSEKPAAKPTKQKKRRA